MTATELVEAREAGRKLANALLLCRGKAGRAIRMGAAMAEHWPRGEEFTRTVRDEAVSLYSESLRTQAVKVKRRRVEK